MSQVKQLIAMSRDTARNALAEYEQGIMDLAKKLDEANVRSNIFLESAQAICKHEYTAQVTIPYTGALPPNHDFDDIPDDTFRTDCGICNKEGI